MADVVSPEVRSRMMSGIRGKNTKPEIDLRKALFRRGFRYRLHDRKLPGAPDIVLTKYRAVIFIHGCFWHGHECHLFKWPGGERAKFWRDKIRSNIARDVEVNELLSSAKWRRFVVWECAVKGLPQTEIDRVATKLAKWIMTGKNTGEISKTLRRSSGC